MDQPVKQLLYKRGRVWTAMLVMLVTLLALGACGNPTDVAPKQAGGAEPSTSSPAPTPTPAPAPTTKSFKAANGTVEVPANPQRIVTLAPNYAGYLLALGITPVGVPEFILGNPYLKSKLAGAANLGANAPTEPTIEQVLELKPDLIIALTAVKNVDQLQKVAPVVTFETTKNNKELLLELGALTNREQQARAWIGQWDKKIAEYKPQIQAVVKDRTISIVYPSAKGVYLFREGYGRGTEILYSDFGLHMPDKAAQSFEAGKGFVTVGLESLPELAGDFIFTAPWLGDAAGADTVYNSPIWKGLPAVKEGRAFPVDYNIFTFSDPFSWEGQLEIILDKLLPDRAKTAK